MSEAAAGFRRAPLLLPARLRDRIARHAERAWPSEACGVLLGTAHPGAPSVTRVVPVENTHPRPREGFRIDPIGLARVQAAGGEELIGFYHSHPDRPAGPSDRDLRLGAPGFWYVAVSVRSGRAGARCSWYISPDGTPDAAMRREIPCPS